MAEGQIESEGEINPKNEPKRTGKHARSGRQLTRDVVPHGQDVASQTINNWWNTPGIAHSWSEGEGINLKTRFAIQDTLAKSRFYQGLTPDSNILDLGVGAKTYLAHDLIPPGAHVFAADKSTEMLTELHKTSPVLYEDFVETDARSLKFKPNQFDRIVSTLMMRYLTNEDQKKAILEMIRTAKSGAQIHIIDFDTVDNYPDQVDSFDPDRLIVDFQLSKFQNQLQALGKKIETVSVSEIPRSFEGAQGHLHYMTLDLAA